MPATLTEFDDRPLRKELKGAGFILADESFDAGDGCQVPLAAFYIVPSTHEPPVLPRFRRVEMKPSA